MAIQGREQLASELARIRKGDGKPVYLVHGDERYLVRESAERLAAELAKRSGAELVRVDATGLSPEAALEPVVSLGLFASARVAVVRNFAPLLTGDSADRLLASLDAGLVPGSAIVFAASGESAIDHVDKRVRGYKGLVHRGVVLELDEQKEEDLKPWLIDQAEREGKKLDADAADLLLHRAGKDMGRLRSELEKAILFCRDRDRIRAEDLEQLVGQTREDAVWDVATAMAEGRGGRAREMVKDLAANGTHPLVVLTFLVRDARLVLQARLLWERDGRPAYRGYPSFRARVAPMWEAGTFGKGADDVTSINPYAAFRRLEVARTHEVRELRETFARLRRAELDIKSGAAEGPDKVVEGLVLELASRRERTK